MLHSVFSLLRYVTKMVMFCPHSWEFLIFIWENGKVFSLSCTWAGAFQGAMVR